MNHGGAAIGFVFFLLSSLPLHPAMRTLFLRPHRFRGHSYTFISKTWVRNAFRTADDSEAVDNSVDNSGGDPFGPPCVLASLKLQETYTPKYILNTAQHKSDPTLPISITRLSHDPDIFVVRNFVPYLGSGVG